MVAQRCPIRCGSRPLQGRPPDGSEPKRGAACKSAGEQGAAHAEALRRPCATYMAPARAARALQAMTTSAGPAASPLKKRRMEDGRDVLQVKRLSEAAVLPVRQSAQAAGYDLARWATFECVVTARNSERERELIAVSADLTAARQRARAAHLL